MNLFFSLINLARTEGSALLAVDASNGAFFCAIGVVLVYLMARRIKRKYHSAAKSSAAGIPESSVYERFFSTHHAPAEKSCPNCAEHLPLSALICEHCDFNFLSLSIGGKHKLLPSPESLAH